VHARLLHSAFILHFKLGRSDLTQLNFYIVDVFALEKYTGNQLAIFTGSGAISKHEMQQIANVTDTIFLNTCDTQRSEKRVSAC